MTDVSTTTDPAKDGQTIELLSFLVSGQDYCVDIMSVREIRGSARATPLPHAPPYMRGVINLRGAVLPIMDLSARLDLETTSDTSRNVIIVVSTNDRTVGLMVDAVSDILALSESNLQPPPEMPADEGRAFISALTIVDDKMIRVLNLAEILPTVNEDAA